ncbi:MAG: hypothetical protein AAF447_15770 [Myxococcota bacterium]
MTQGDGFGGKPSGGQQGGPGQAQGGQGLGGPAEVGGFGGAAPVPGFGPQGAAPQGGSFGGQAPGGQGQAPAAGSYGAASGGGYDQPPAGGGYGGPPGGGYGGPAGGSYGGPPGGGPPGGGYGAAPPASASVEQVLENFKLLMSRSSSTGIWGALGAYALIDIFFDLVGLVPRYLVAKRLAEGDLFGAGASAMGSNACTFLPLVVGFFVVGAGRLGIVRAQREALLQGAQTRSPGDVLKLSFERFGASLVAMIVFTLLSTVAACLCVLPVIPAVWAMFMVPFLVAASGMDLGSAFGKSFELAQQHALAIFGTMGMITLVYLVFFACNLFTGGGPTAVVVGGLFMAVFKAGVGMIIWQLVGATQITIESVATNMPIARD